MDRSSESSAIHKDAPAKVTVTTPPSYVFKRPREDMDTSLSDQLHDFKEEIVRMMRSMLEEFGTEIKTLSSTLKDIQKSNQKIESSISLLTAQTEEMQKKIETLEKAQKLDKDYISVLENRIEDLQITGRKSNFQLKNVPKLPNESKDNLIEMVLNLAKTIDCQMVKSDIKDIYRVRGGNTKDTPIVVETGSTLLKADIMRMGKSFNIRHKEKLCAKHLGYRTHESTPIYLSEHLTLRGSRLHFLARDIAKSKSYKFCWTAYGKVYVRKNENSPIIMIKNEDQAHKLLQSD